MAILPEISSSWTRNLPEECFSAVNYKLKNDKSTGGTVTPPGITSSLMSIQADKIKMHEKSSELYKFQDHSLQRIHAAIDNFFKS
jgi:hypothetical protein